MMPRFFAFALFAIVLGAPLVFHARERARTERAAQQPSLASSASIRGPSIYRLRSAWTTDQGRNVHLGDLRGQLQIMALIFTSCPRACPTLVKELKALERRLTDDVDGEVRPGQHRSGAGHRRRPPRVSRANGPRRALDAAARQGRRRS